jgi:hypothetical protein
VVRGSLRLKPRAELRKLVEARKPELEQDIFTRIFAIADGTQGEDPEYLQGLRAAVEAALEYGLASIENGEGVSNPPPPKLLAQARLAGRLAIGLETVLRRYLAGYMLLGDYFAMEAARIPDLTPAALQSVMRSQAIIFDRLLVAVSDEYRRGESERRRSGSEEERRQEQIEMLLDGELVHASALRYEFDAHHLAFVVAGMAGAARIRKLQQRLDCRSLTANRPDGTVWGWLGARRAIDTGALECAMGIAGKPDGDLQLAIGEPGYGLAGWRLSHRQAMRAWSVVVRDRDRSVARYAEVGLLATVAGDEVLTRTLTNTFLEPLYAQRDDGRALCETLRAYFATECSVTSAAALLGVSRQTVRSRLRTAEERIGRSLAICRADMEIALRLLEITENPRYSAKESVGGS